MVSWGWMAEEESHGYVMRNQTGTRTRLVATGPGSSLGCQRLFFLEAFFMGFRDGSFLYFFGRYFCVCERQGVVGAKPDTPRAQFVSAPLNGGSEDWIRVLSVLFHIGCDEENK